MCTPLDERLIGDIYLKNEADFFWIGYTIHPHESQKGYGSEVIQATIQWLFDQGVQSVKAEVAPGNLASIKLFRKTKFFVSQNGRRRTLSVASP